MSLDHELWALDKDGELMGEADMEVDEAVLEVCIFLSEEEQEEFSEADLSLDDEISRILINVTEEEDYMWKVKVPANWISCLVRADVRSLLIICSCWLCKLWSNQLVLRTPLLQLSNIDRPVVLNSCMSCELASTYLTSTTFAH